MVDQAATWPRHDWPDFLARVAGITAAPSGNHRRRVRGARAESQRSGLRLGLTLAVAVAVVQLDRIALQRYAAVLWVIGAGTRRVCRADIQRDSAAVAATVMIDPTNVSVVRAQGSMGRRAVTWVV